MGRGITPNSEYSGATIIAAGNPMSAANQTAAIASMTKMYKTAFKSNTNNTVLSGGMVTPLPEANGRTNTALGYKQTTN